MQETASLLKEIVMYELLALGIVAIAALFFQQWLHIKERESLLNRIMANSYKEYEYYQKMFEGEVKELKDQRDKAKEDISEEEEIKEQMDLEYKKEKEFVKTTDEDWEDEEVDYEKLREIRKGR